MRMEESPRKKLKRYRQFLVSSTDRIFKVVLWETFSDWHFVCVGIRFSLILWSIMFSDHLP